MFRDGRFSTVWRSFHEIQPEFFDMHDFCRNFIHFPMREIIFHEIVFSCYGIPSSCYEIESLSHKITSFSREIASFSYDTKACLSLFPRRSYISMINLKLSEDLPTKKQKYFECRIKQQKQPLQARFFPIKQVVLFICWNHNEDVSYNFDGFVRILENVPKK